MSDTNIKIPLREWASATLRPAPIDESSNPPRFHASDFVANWTDDDLASLAWAREAARDRLMRRSRGAL